MISQTLPITVSVIFLGLAVWVAIAAWNQPPEGKKIKHWRETTLPPEILKLPGEQRQFAGNPTLR